MTGTALKNAHFAAYSCFGFIYGDPTGGVSLIESTGASS
jgi:hypothetical protein